jgi:hypothetical protein
MYALVASAHIFLFVSDIAPPALFPPALVTALKFERASIPFYLVYIITQT